MKKHTIKDTVFIFDSWKEVHHMLKKYNTILNFIIGTFIGLFISSSIYKYFDYINHPDLYIVQSSPWYTSIQIQGISTFIIVFIAIIFKFVLKRRNINT